MKKQELKQRLLQANATLSVLSDTFIKVSTQLEEVSEALDRRRILYDRLVNHSTREQPKSMREMAEDLYDTCMKRESSFLKEKWWLEFEDLPESEQDEWMDRLLTILN